MHKFKFYYYKVKNTNEIGRPERPCDFISNKSVNNYNL